MELRDLPALNATLNATAFVLLLIGYRLIRQGKREAHKRVMLAAFTVDPEHDTPEILAAYAKRYKADPARWFFLTGERAAISAVARDGFQVGALDTAQGHSTRILLVDGENRVRGHFPEAEKEALLAGIAAVYEDGK